MPEPGKLGRGALLIALAVVLLRVAFLNQAIQGDDYYYLSGAMYAQIDPLHPTHVRYVFAGNEVDVRGHPHPPLNMWVLGGLLAALGDIYEIPFHGAYVVFSLMAALGMWVLAKRFSPAPGWATLLFVAVPVFVVNGNSLESDLPFLAFWMAAAAMFIRAVDRRSASWLAGATAAMAAAALAAYQSVVLIPILALYLALNRRKWALGWVALLSPAVTLGAWQLFERATGGALPAGVLAGYFESYGLQRLANKLNNAAALTVHAGWLVCPVLAWAAFWELWRPLRVTAMVAMLAGAAFLDSNPLFWAVFGTGVLVVLWCLKALGERADKDQLFLAGWFVVFFAGALALFFAGAARYLLPVAAPVCVLVTRRLAGRKKWLAGGFAVHLGLGLCLAVMNYEHWGGYREFVRELKDEFEQRRVWVNGEWGLRFYAEAEGGLPLVRGQPVQPGEVVISSRIAYPTPFTTGGGMPVLLAERPITSRLPLRMIGLGVRSAYSTVTLGYRPFDVVRGPIDVVRAELVVSRQPQLSYLPMNAPAAETQIASGIYELEEGRFRWMGGRGVILLKRPAAPSVLEVSLYVPEQAPGRRVTASVDGKVVVQAEFARPGSYTLASDGPVAVESDPAQVVIEVDRTFSPPGDQRELGLILSAAGFREVGR